MLVVAVVGSPNVGGRTRVAVDAMLRGAAAEGAQTQVLELAETEPADAVAAIDAADAAILGSPTYRADISARLKMLLEMTPRGAPGESAAPLRGKACATIMTGASDHHFLAVDKVRGTLSGFFATQLLSPGLYLPASAYTEDGGALRDAMRELTEVHGRALVELATTVRSSKFLRELRPLI
jgi:FMN reductase